MKFCTQCGTQLYDDALFCTVCGKATSAPTEPAPPPPPADFVVPPMAVEEPVAMHPVMAKLKEMLSSKLALAIAVCVSIAAVFGLISTSVNDLAAVDDLVSGYEYEYDSYYDDYYDYDYEDGYDYLYDDIYETSDTSTGLDLTVAMCILATIAMWMLYASAKDRQYPGVKPGGFTVLRVSNIVVFVLSTIVLSFGILACIVLVILSATGGLSSLMQQFGMDMTELYSEFYGMGLSYRDIYSMVDVIFVVAFVIVLLVFVGFLVLSIFAFIKSQKTIVSLRQTARVGEPAKEISPFVGVLCYIFGGMSGLTALIGSSNAFGFFYNGALSAALIMAAILLFKLRREMNCFVPVAVDEPVTIQPPVEIPAQPIQETPIADETPAEPPVAEQSETAPTEE